MGLIKIGAKAPGFELPNQDNTLISLEQFSGKWVVTYFYPKADTPGCTVQACGVKDRAKDWSAVQAVVLGISPDKPAALKKFAEKQGLAFQLLGDVDHKVADAYGTWQEKSMYGRTYMGMARSTYIIDPKGIIRHVIAKADPKTHAADVLDWLKENQGK